MNASNSLRQFKTSKWVITQFFTRRQMKLATIWGLVFGLTTMGTALAIAKSYSTQASLNALGTSFGNNAGIKMILGEPWHINSVAGFTAWRAFGIAVLVGSIWGFLTATKLFRGEEESGRLEIMLTGETTARRAAVNMFLAFAVCIGIIYISSTIPTLLTGLSESVNFSVSSSLFSGLAIIAPAAMMISVGAFMSQIMPTRSRAAAASAVVFGIFFLLRGIAATSSDVHWLLYVTPLGWVGELHALTQTQAIWLIPIGAFIALFVGLTVWLAGKRDVGDSIIADKDSVSPRFGLLGSPLGLSLRLTRPVMLGWWAAVTVIGLVFGSVAKSAGDVLGGSGGLQQTLGKITSLRISGVTLFLGFIFFMVMTVLMIQVASAVNALREEEAEGRLDNILVGPIGRLRWLSGRLGLIIMGVVVAALLVSTTAWVSLHALHVNVAYHKMLEAALNALVPALLIGGIGILVVGFLPRLTSIVMYAFIGWSFIVQMIGPIANVNHWILDTSILHHMALVPAVDPQWKTLLMLAIIALVMALIGMWRFRVRDLETT